MKSKSRVLAALLNFLMPGVGYLYVGRRVGFGVVLFLGELLAWIGIAVGESNSFGMIFVFGAVLLSLAFAGDAWNEAGAVNRERFETSEKG